MKKKPNNYGGIAKLSGKRSRPYMAYKNELVSQPNNLSKKEGNALKTAISALKGGNLPVAIPMLLDAGVSEADICSALMPLASAREFKAVYKKVAIGYYKTSTEAERALADANFTTTATSGVTFKELYDKAYVAKKIDTKKGNTKSAYTFGIKKCEPLWNRKVKDLRTADFQTLLDSYSDMSASSISRIKVVMNFVCEYGVEQDFLGKNYASYALISSDKAKVEKTAFTMEEIAALWKSEDPFAKHILILIYTGMRKSEYQALTEEDIQDGLIHIKEGKTKAASRYIPIHPDIAQLIDVNSIPRGDYEIYHGFEKLTPHTIHETRHTFATYSTRLNSALRAYIMGHATTLTNDTYSHFENLKSGLKEEILKLDFGKIRT